jgi:hypothetical protein
VRDELEGEPYTVEPVRSVVELVARLTGEASAPLIAIADFDAMSEEELLHIESLHERGWDGTVIALGRPEVEARTALRIQTAIPRPFGSEALRKAVSELATSRPSMQDLRAALDGRRTA